jgi:hypothetical protein
VTSWIYFIQNTFTRNLKIGQSDEPPRRRNAFKTGNDCELEILGVIPGDKKLEAELHRRFAHLQIKNVGREWFYGTPELYGAVELLLSPKPALFGREIKSVYLAGKITDSPWRKQFFEPGVNPRCEPCEGPCHDAWFEPGCVPVPGSKWSLDFTGPFWLDVSCGHGTPSEGAHAFGELLTGAGSGTVHGLKTFQTDGNYVRDRCLDGVSRADLIFAWIDGLDCFGTMAEIVWAYSRKLRGQSGHPVIVIAPSHVIDFSKEAWFITGMADAVVHSRSPVEAWEKLWRSQSQVLEYTDERWVYRCVEVQYDDEDFHAGIPTGPDGIIDMPEF